MLIDTHCHIHDVEYPLDIDEVIERAHSADVMEIICIGTGEDDSLRAVEFAKNHDGVYATIGVHPHEVVDRGSNIGHSIESILLENGFAQGLIGVPTTSQTLAADAIQNKGLQQNSNIANRKIVAIGEIGLDYYHDSTDHEIQKQVLAAQIDVALKFDLPIVFHVRDAYDDFWPIFDRYQGKIRGVLHSFSDNAENVNEALKRGLYISVNGLSTFTKIEEQKNLFAGIPLHRLLFETDAPYLTPVPFRGKVNEPAFVGNIADFHANIRQVSVSEIADVTTANARKLFGI